MHGTPFDPANSGAPLPASLAEAVGSGEHPVILLVVTAGARRSGWGAASAVALADRLAAFTGKVFLADLDFESPSLHDRLGAPNEEGLADVFFYGASLRHVTHRLTDHRFELISAGAFVPEPASVLRHDRWTSIANDLGPGAILLACVPAEEEGALDLAARAFDAVVFGQPDEIESLRGRWPAQAAVLATFTPPTPADTPLQKPADAPSPAVADAPSPEPAEPARVESSAQRVTDPPAGAGPESRDGADRFEEIRIPRDAAREALIAELRQRQREALMSPEPPPVREGRGAGGAPARASEDTIGLGLPIRPGVRPGAAPAEVPLTEPILPGKREGKRGRGRRVFVSLLSLILLAALAAGAWVAVRYWLERPAAQESAVRASTPTAEPVVNAPSPPPVEGPLPFSVAIEMHNALSLADERARSLADEEPGISFFVTPVLVDSVLYYAVLAGPAADSAQAQAIVARLLETGLKTVSTPGDVRNTPLAFLLGEFETKEQAEARRNAAFQLGVPSYIIEARTARGPRYRLYAGAYAGRGDSRIMRELLRNAGLPDSLVNRAGISPS